MTRKGRDAEEGRAIMDCAIAAVVAGAGAVPVLVMGGSDMNSFVIGVWNMRS